MVSPRSRTGSVAVTTRLRDAKKMCFQRPKSGWQSGTTSIGRSRRLYFLPMYPYPTHGGAGPVSGGHRGRQGRVQNPVPLREEQAGKGVKGRLPPAGKTGFVIISYWYLWFYPLGISWDKISGYAGINFIPRPFLDFSIFVRVYTPWVSSPAAGSRPLMFYEILLK